MSDCSNTRFRLGAAQVDQFPFSHHLGRQKAYERGLCPLDTILKDRGCLSPAASCTDSFSAPCHGSTGESEQRASLIDVALDLHHPQTQLRYQPTQITLPFIPVLFSERHDRPRSNSTVPSLSKRLILVNCTCS